jgi:hypothetical protein
MRDNHVHIGQFKDVYYDALEVADVVMSAGMTGMSFSSTSSCRDNIPYTEIENEITAFLSRMPYASDAVRPFLWYIPDYISQGITAGNASTAIPYQGIKIHPFAQSWDFDNVKHLEALHGLFDHSSRNDLPVLIHTGNSDIDRADRFERFMDEYRRTKWILAHCRPLDVTMELLGKYDNVYCDTSFVPEADIRQIGSLGFKDKIIFGSDFPITHFWESKYPSRDDKTPISMGEQYAKDTGNWEKLKNDL